VELQEQLITAGEQLRFQQPVVIASVSLTVTMSFGVAVTSDMDQAEQLLRRADEALYKAKEEGRNRVVFSDM
jgi:diguanylate cyclase (GGDEF)-like protein